MSAVGITYDELEDNTRPHRRPRSYWADRPLSTSDDLVFPAHAAVYSPEFGGKPVTPGMVDRARSVDRLTKLMSRFALYGLSWDIRPASRIGTDTAASAAAFIRSLSSAKRLPRIAPDGEGNLVLFWEAPASLLVTIEGWRAHVVFNAATPQATYLHNVPLSGLAIPPAIYGAIPSN